MPQLHYWHYYWHCGCTVILHCVSVTVTVSVSLSLTLTHCGTAGSAGSLPFDSFFKRKIALVHNKFLVHSLTFRPNVYLKFCPIDIFWVESL